MRDEHGEEMHKSKGNAIWFDEAAESDGRRRHALALSARVNPSTTSTSATTWRDEVRRRFILPLWNSYAFFATYARAGRLRPDRPGQRRAAGRAHAARPLDLSRLQAA